MQNMVFVGLHNHSVFSIQDSISEPEDMVKKTKELGMDAIAITEHGTLASHFQMYEAGKKHGVKIIFGVEAYFMDDVKTIERSNDRIAELEEEKKVLKKDKAGKIKLDEIIKETKAHKKTSTKYYHLILLAKNYQGYQNLIKIHNSGVIDGFYGKPRIDWEVLEKYRGGLIASSACLGGKICKRIEAGQMDEAIKDIARFKSIFGEDFYLELQLNDIKIQHDANMSLIELSRITDTPLNVTCFPAGTKIETINGQRNIENINIGDMVLSHDGLFHEVKKLYANEATQLIRIKPNYGSDWVAATPEHPILVARAVRFPGGVYRKSFEEPKFIPISEIQIGDALCYPKKNISLKVPTQQSRIQHRKTDKYYHSVVKKIETIDFRDTVYNLEVEETNTYVANGWIVHNCDTHYVEKEEAKTRSLLYSLNSKPKKDDGPNDVVNDSFMTDLFIKNEVELLAAWGKYMPGVPKKILGIAIQNTRKISDSVQSFDLDTSLKFPIFDTNGLTQEDHLAQMAWKGLAAKNLTNVPGYKERLQKELNTITKLGFAAYFNVVGDMIIHAKKHQSVGLGRGCVLADTPIYMQNNNVKKIIDIRSGDKVITHDGTEQEVINIMRYPCSETLLTLQPWIGKSITMTEDHKVYVHKVKRILNNPKNGQYEKTTNFNYDWVQAGELKQGDWLFVPKIIRSNISDEKYIDLASFSKKYDEKHIEEIKYSNLKKENSIREIHRNTGLSRNAIKNYLKGGTYSDAACAVLENIDIVDDKKTILVDRFLEIDEDFLYFLGRFCGDGWIASDNRPSIGLAFNGDDSEGIKKLTNFCNTKNLTFNIVTHKTKNCKQVYIYSAVWHKLIKKLFNQYECSADTKHIPEFVFNLPENLIKSFISGYQESDGSSKEPYRIRFATVSKQLAQDLGYIFRILNIPSSESHSYRNYPHLNLQNKLSIVISIPNLKHINQNNNWEILKNGYALRIKQISKNIKSDFVYDIEVENNHSYLSNFAVHNSAAGSLLSYAVGITDVDPIKWELYFERFLDESKGVVAPTFGIKKLIDVQIDYTKILGDCACNQH